MKRYYKRRTKRYIMKHLKQTPPRDTWSNPMVLPVLANKTKPLSLFAKVLAWFSRIAY